MNHKFVNCLAYTCINIDSFLEWGGGLIWIWLLVARAGVHIICRGIVLVSALDGKNTWENHACLSIILILLCIFFCSPQKYNSNLKYLHIAHNVKKTHTNYNTHSSHKFLFGPPPSYSIRTGSINARLYEDSTWYSKSNYYAEILNVWFKYQNFKHTVRLRRDSKRKIQLLWICRLKYSNSEFERWRTRT